MTALSKTTFSTPLGEMLAVASEKGLCLLTFTEEQPFISHYLQHYYPTARLQNTLSETLKQTKSWLKAYFAKHPKLETFPPFDLQGSQKARAILKALYRVPFGKTKTYGELAKTQNPNSSPRAVGGIVGRNPIAIMIPCHRIIGKDGTLRGFRSGLERKQWLLKHESITLPLGRLD